MPAQRRLHRTAERRRHRTFRDQCSGGDFNVSEGLPGQCGAHRSGLPVCPILRPQRRGDHGGKASAGPRNCWVRPPHVRVPLVVKARAASTRAPVGPASLPSWGNCTRLSRSAESIGPRYPANIPGISARARAIRCGWRMATPPPTTIRCGETVNIRLESNCERSWATASHAASSLANSPGGRGSLACSEGPAINPSMQSP
jgi:hypothetical protein